MADPRKNQTLVVVVVILSCLSAPAMCFTQDLSEYTQEISRRSFALMDGFFDTDGLVMRFGYPIFIIITFFSALNQLCMMLSGFIPGLGGGLMGLSGPLAMLAGISGQEVAKARDGEERDQRLLDYVEDQVKSSVVAGQGQFENELKKKK